MHRLEFPRSCERKCVTQRKWLLLAAALLMTLPEAALGLTFTVNVVGDGGDTNIGDTICDADAATSGQQCTLRGAIQEANAHVGDDSIDFLITDFFGGADDTPTIILTSQLPDLSTNIEISGPGAGQLAVSRVNGGGGYAIFKVTAPGLITISGLTIRNGGGEPVQDLDGVNREIMRFGGGIWNFATGTVNVSNCVVVRNHASNGGGIANTSTGTVNLINCTVSDNTALFDGGGISNETGTVNVANCTISGNAVTRPTGIGQGGGFSIYGGNVNVTNSTISGNQVAAGDNDRKGGGFYIDDGTLNLTNCTISGNSSAKEGGGIFNYNGTVNLLSSTVTGNSATDGGGYFGVNVLGGNAQNNIKNSIIALNTATNSGPDLIGESFTSQGFNLIGKNNSGEPDFPAGNPNANKDIVGTSASPINPMLDPNGLQNNGGPASTIALRFNSPAIDKGTSLGMTGTLTVDQRGVGFLRKIDNSSVPNAAGGDGTDIGAFEFGAHIDVVSRKIHGSTPRDIVLPLSGLSGIECRSGGASGNHQVVVTFPVAITLGGVSVVSSDGMAYATESVNNQIVTIDLQEVANAQTLMITLANLSDGPNTNDLSFPISILLGDTNENGSVNASDVSLTKLKSGQAVDASNFRTDATVSNSINASDVSTVKSKSGTALP